ncbi:TonB-dependent receptor [Fulvivirgaceae bacterium BMA12]|uniref:TonB-dependent receptor n=1 Tax=Agaribacillus aureus TaxID=3051825 RepID=A0ABT8L0T5_9BACT|nr:TonB-dependent receptor [Fulvivirgaceae bacterium BMA12]
MSKYTIFGIFLQFLFYSFIFAGPGNAQKVSLEDIEISVEFDGISIKKAFREIENLTEFEFVYRKNIIDGHKRLNQKRVYASIADILRKISKETDLRFKRVDETIYVREKNIYGSILTEKITENSILDREISGKVTDENEEGLPGVNILIKGTKIGTVTDAAGNYKLLAPDDAATLVFTYVGYITEEVQIGSQRIIDISLTPDISKLSEIVVVGFGTQKKESVVGSISSVTPSELKVPSSNLTTALAGRVAGVVAYQTSGEPGRDNAQFFVRGITTFAQGARPLILIDGVELSADDLARLQPDDIESFSVLKDATSTAVYGARGANGIIYVTTKRGINGKPAVSLRLENSFSSNIHVPELADPISYMTNFNEAVRTRRPGTLIPFSEEKILNTQLGTNADVFPAVDWQDELIKDVTVNRRVNLNVRGGGEVAQYYIAASFNQDNGILKEDPRNNVENNINLNRYLLRANVNVNLTKSTEAIIRLHSTLDEFRGPAVDAATIFTQTLLTSPVRFPAVYNPDSANVNTPNILFGNQQISNNNFYVNPYHQLVSGFTQSSRSLALVQFELKQDLSAILPGLRARFLGNNNRTTVFALRRNTQPFFYHAELFNYNPVENTYVLTRLNDDGNRALSFNGGDSSVENVLYTEVALNYDRTFGDHTVSGLLVGIGREASRSTAGTLEESLPLRNLGLSGRLTYALKDRYFAEFNFGYNGSERFAKNNRFGFFPSVGAAWLISNEPFFESVSPSFINRLKLRASYGIVGNDAIGGQNDRFFYRSQVNLDDASKGYTFGEEGSATFIPGISIGNYENTSITWERAKTLNVGLELNLFDDAVVFIAEYFSQQRDNILQTRLTPASLGLQAQNRDNVGAAFTEGIDLSLDGNKYITNDFWVSVRGTFTYSNGKFDKFEEPDYGQRNAPFRARTGTKINQRLGYIAERLFLDEEEVANSPQQSFGGIAPQAGDIKYIDINKDGVINDLDRVPIGKPVTPQVTYGMGFSLGYKNFDFSAFFQGNAEVSVFINPAATAPFITRIRGEDQLPGGLTNFNLYTSESTLLKAYADNHWTETNRDIYALYPRLSDGLVGNNVQPSTWWLRDGSFLRLKQVEIGYNIKKIAGISNLRIYVTGTNLITWSKFRLWDPEIAADPNVGGTGFGYPLQRVINLGILVNF